MQIQCLKQTEENCTQSPQNLCSLPNSNRITSLRNALLHILPPRESHDDQGAFGERHAIPFP
jgi:hypothetical protein